MQIILKGFGSLKALSGIVIEFNSGASIATLREKLIIECNQKQKLQEFIEIIATAAFASIDQILTEDEIIADSTTLYVLPPVCGG